MAVRRHRPNIKHFCCGVIIHAPLFGRAGIVGFVKIIITDLEIYFLFSIEGVPRLFLLRLFHVGDSFNRCYCLFVVFDVSICVSFVIHFVFEFIITVEKRTRSLQDVKVEVTHELFKI